MARWGLFGARPVGAVSVVEAPVSRSYAAKARAAFFVVSPVVGVLVAAVLAAGEAHPVVAVLAGVVAGPAAGVVVGLLVRVWPVLRVLWWWATEIVVTGAVLAGSVWLARVTHPLLSVAALLLVAGVLFGVPGLRRRVAAWSWCLVVRHRLRLCFAEFVRSVSRTGSARLPLILWARPTPAGERVWIWLRPGLDLTDLEGKAGKLAVTCWAGEVRLVRASARYAALLRVDVTRRDPLTVVVASPLAAWLPWATDPAAPVSPGMPPSGLDLTDIPEPAPDTNRRR